MNLKEIQQTAERHRTQADAHDDLAAAITRFQDATGQTIEISFVLDGEQLASLTSAAITFPDDDDDDEIYREGAPWTTTEILRMIDLRAAGRDWNIIAATLGRIPDECREKHEEETRRA